MIPVCQSTAHAMSNQSSDILLLNNGSACRLQGEPEKVPTFENS